jgi:zinc transporter, ZIP family
VAESPALVVFAVALATAVATGAGAVPFAFGRLGMQRWLGAGNAIASGVMLGASAGLLIEGVDRDALRTAIGVLAGAAFAHSAYRFTARHHNLRMGVLRGSSARDAILIVSVMTAHSAAEGIGIGAAFGDSGAFGLVIALAIAIQNVPEGLAISLVLVPRGMRVRAAVAWSVFSSLPQPLVAVPAFLFVEQFASVLPIGLGFAAGAMVWMVARQLLPEAFARARRRAVLLNGVLAFLLMLAMQLKLAS